MSRPRNTEELLPVNLYTENLWEPSPDNLPEKQLIGRVLFRAAIDLGSTNIGDIREAIKWFKDESVINPDNVEKEGISFKFCCDTFQFNSIQLQIFSNLVRRAERTIRNKTLKDKVLKFKSVKSRFRG